MRIAMMMKDEAERKYLRKHTREMSSATPSKKRRIRDEARQKGKHAYASALERSIRTTEAEKQVLRSLLRTYENDRKLLMIKLRPYGIVLVD